MNTDLGELYAAARHRITDLVLSSPAEAAAAACPATPEWNVHDVLAHCRGITEDVRLGNIAGAGTDPWTAEQVTRHRDTSIADLIAGWSADAPLLESVLSSPGGDAVSRVVIDVHTHEADIRAALGRPQPLTDEFIEWALPALCAGLFDSVAAAGLAPLAVVATDAGTYGPADAAVTVTTSAFELFRARLGRRSRNQVWDYDWGGADPTPYLEHFFIFGPRPTELVEA